MTGIVAHTYSIVARCPLSGELGAAVASAVPAVGAVCLFMRARVGVVSTQSWTNPYLALAMLDAIEAGQSAMEALPAVLAGDRSKDVRQFGAIGLLGPAAAWTGASCTPWCGQRTGDHFAVQGNMLTGAPVIDAMASAFTASPGEPLDERLMQALEAAQAAGGDKRGRQAAALRVIGREDYARVDLRVDEHHDPVRELRRVMGVARAQLAPFVEGMPRRGEEPGPAAPEVVELLMKSPPERPGGGGSAKP